MREEFGTVFGGERSGFLMYAEVSYSVEWRVLTLIVFNKLHVFPFDNVCRVSAAGNCGGNEWFGWVKNGWDFAGGRSGIFVDDASKGSDIFHGSAKLSRQ
jgi:hypothetical protein